MAHSERIPRFDDLCLLVVFLLSAEGLQVCEPVELRLVVVPKEAASVAQVISDELRI